MAQLLSVIAKGLTSLANLLFGPVVKGVLSPRSWSLVIDGFICVVVWGSALSAVGVQETGFAAAVGLLATCCVYHVVLTGLAGVTVGKLVLKHRVVNLADGGKPGLWRATRRMVSLVVPLGFGQVPLLPDRYMRVASGVVRNRFSGTAVVELELARMLPTLAPESRRAALVELGAARAQIDADPAQAEPVEPEDRKTLGRIGVVLTYVLAAAVCWGAGHLAGVRNDTTGSLVVGYGGGFVVTLALWAALRRRTRAAMRRESSPSGELGPERAAE